MRTAKILGALALCSTAIVVPAAAASADPGPAIGPPTMIGQITGAGGINNTHSQYDVWGTDLGITWDDGFGHVMSAYGDTFGAPFTPPEQGGAPNGGNWRCNVLARSNDQDLSDGMSFVYMVTNGPGQPAKQLLPCKQVPGDEHTVIPTAGVSVDGRQIMHYMSVRQWGQDGHWYTNYAGLAYSDDWGNNWVKDAVTWQNNDGTNKFQMAALARRDGYVYLFGTPNGRTGGAHVARVPEGSVLDKNAYEYWNGSAWAVGSDTQAATIVPPTVGEMSVQFNTHLDKWLMMNTDYNRQAIVLRQADSPQGPWSDPTVVITGPEYPGYYGGFMHPWSSGSDLYFQVSVWGPYNTYLMRVSLSDR
jgi:Domain of unknown function (DUF4185)